MGSRLYIGNLPYSIRDHDLHRIFTPFGTVMSARVMMERETGRSKGFGFVEMDSDAQAYAAIQGLAGQTLGGRSLVVNEARPMELRPPRQSTGDHPSLGHAGRNDGGFRSPYGLHMRNRNNVNTAPRPNDSSSNEI